MQGPDFQAWDLKFGLIGPEDPDWTQRAIEDGTLGNRALSCKVIRQLSTIRFPLPATYVTPSGGPAFVKCGLTFEYKTYKPDITYAIEITYPPRAELDSPEVQTEGGHLPGNPSGKTGRACYAVPADILSKMAPGTYCYRVSIEGVNVRKFCVDLSDATTPNG